MLNTRTCPECRQAIPSAANECPQCGKALFAGKAVSDDSPASGAPSVKPKKLSFREDLEQRQARGEFKGMGWAAAALVVFLAIQALCGQWQSAAHPYSASEYGAWMGDVKAAMQTAAPGVSVQWGGTEPGQIVKVLVAVPCTKREAMELCQVTANNFMARFPKQDSVSVWVEDYNSMQRIYGSAFRRE